MTDRNDPTSGEHAVNDALDAICAEPCSECGGTIVLKDHGGRAYVWRGSPVQYPSGLLIPTCEQCGSIWTDAALSDRIKASFDAQRRVQALSSTG